MNIIKKIAKNTISLIGAQIATSILSIVLSIFIARKLGDISYGKYSFTLAYVSIFVLFSDLGYNTLMIRDIARDKSQAHKYLSNVLSFRLLLCFIIIVLIVITTNIIEYPTDTKYLIYIFGLYVLITSISDVFRIIFRSFERMEYEAITRTLSSLIRVSLSLIILFLGYGLIELAFVFLLSSILDLIFSLLICNTKFVKFKMELDVNFIKNTIKISIPLAMLTFYSLIYIKADTIMLSIMKGDATVGWYNAAYNLILGFKPIPKLIFTVMFPLMSSYYVSSKESLNIVCEKSFKYLFSLGLPLALGITLLADQIIITIYGQQFQNSIIALQILAWDALLIFSYTPLAGLLVSSNSEKKMNIFAGTTAFLNIVLNLILIPQFSYVGAAVSTIISESLLFVLYYLTLAKKQYKLPLRNIIIYPAIASSVMGLFIHFYDWTNLYVIIILSIVIYFVVFYIMGGISKEDIKLIKKTYGKHDKEEEYK